MFHKQLIQLWSACSLFDGRTDVRGTPLLLQVNMCKCRTEHKGDINLQNGYTWPPHAVAGCRHVPGLDVARACCCGICVPGRTSVFHRQDMGAYSTVILCAVYNSTGLLRYILLAASASFFVGLALQAVLDCLVRV